MNEHTLARIHSLALEIETERARQIEVHGWTPELDDRFVDGELKAAAIALLCDDGYFWPWGQERYNGAEHTERERLVKAAAMMIAEIERLDRLSEEDASNEN